MSERENTAASVYAGLVTLVLGLCLAGAFVLPPWLVHSKVLGGIALIAFFVAPPFLIRAAHRSRIRDAVEREGGTVLAIKKLPFYKQRSFLTRYAAFMPTQHDVEYIDLLGNRHIALCDSGFFQGVVWREDRLCGGEARR